MKKLNFFLAIPIIASVTLFTSCETDKTELVDTPETEEFNEVSQEILDKLTDLAFNPEGAEYIDFVLPDGSTCLLYTSDAADD